MPKAPQNLFKPQFLWIPGFAGIFTMVFADMLWRKYQLPPRWTALVLSFAFGVVALTVGRVPFTLRVIFYLYNSCIIFLVAVGCNRVGQIVTVQIAKPKSTLAQQTVGWTGKVQTQTLQRLDMSARDRTSGSDRRRPTGTAPTDGPVGLAHESSQNTPVTASQTTRTPQTFGNGGARNSADQSPFFANW